MKKSQRHSLALLGTGPLPKGNPVPVLLTLCLWLFSFVSVALAYESLGKPTGYVNDFAEVISAEQKAAIESQLVALEKDMGVEISVVTVPSLGDETIETYAVELFEEWGIGKAKTDNGLLFLVAPNEREVRIETGYGLEPVITDVVASTIIREVAIPAFREGSYGQGIEHSVGMIVGVLRNSPEAVSFVETRAQTPTRGFSGLLTFALIFIVQMIPVIIYSKSWWLGGVLGFVLGFIISLSLVPAIVLAFIGLVADYFLSKKFGGKRPPGHHGGVWFGGSR
jgi:uncharacterized protein